jgi:hypothetical protein
VLPSQQADVFDALELDLEETSTNLPAPGGGNWGGGRMWSTWSGPRRQDRRDNAMGPNIAILVPTLSRLDNCHCNLWITDGQPNCSAANAHARGSIKLCDC